MRDRVKQIGLGLAQLKHIDSLKLCDLGFWRVLMTVDILILVVVSRQRLREFERMDMFEVCHLLLDSLILMM